LTTFPLYSEYQNRRVIPSAGEELYLLWNDSVEEKMRESGLDTVRRRFREVSSGSYTIGTIGSKLSFRDEDRAFASH
jgi:hypothetical protein